MNIFDILGPIMIGPSSSHTAGAVRIGRVVRILLNEEVKEAKIILYGSFAATYKGHGTDKAIVAGLLGYNVADYEIKDSINIAKNKGYNYIFEESNVESTHPNTVKIYAVGVNDKKIEITASSIGGGNILVKNINGIEVDFTGQYHTLIVPHDDKTGTISLVTHILAVHNINIACMKMFRKHKKGKAIMIIETDQEISKDISLEIKKIEHIDDAIILKVF